MVHQFIKTASSVAMIAGLSVATFAGIGVAGASQGYRPQYAGQQYSAQLLPLNNSNVTGNVQLSFRGKELAVNLTATGLVPGKVHPAHIHGSLTGADASCPNEDADVNNDGFVSVFEGAPFYGPIKLNLTSPQTAFGPPANLTLFAPFAGKPNLNNFPMSTAAGSIALNQTYSFDLSKAVDREAYQQLRMLDKQHIVVHGGYAPESVDTAGGSSTVVYDALLPVACGQIHMSFGQNGRAQMHLNMNKLDARHASSFKHDDKHDNDN